MANFNPYAGYPQQYPQYNGYQQYQPYPQYQQPGQQMQGLLQNPQQPQGQQPAQMVQPQMPGTQQIQSGGFVSVRSIEEAFNYPVQPGKSVTFKDEYAPYVYTKTKGFSQLEEPVFEKYRLVKEENGQAQGQPQEAAPEPGKREEYALKSDFLDAISDFDDLRKQIKNLENQIKNLRKQSNTNPTNRKDGVVEEEKESESE